jgi:hypothetical protein
VIGKIVAVNARRTPEKEAERTADLLKALRAMTVDDGADADQDDAAWRDYVPTGAAGGL